MHTGTVIRDLMAAVDRAERRAEERQMAEERELHAIFAMEVPITDQDGILMGAA